MPDVHDALLIALVCAVCSLDLISAFQVMVSRPLVVGVLLGAVLGDPGTGLASGMILELIWLQQIEVGSVVPPDFTLGAAIAAGGAVLLRRWHPEISREACVAATLLASVPVAWMGGVANLWQRRRHAGLAAWAENALEKKGDESALAKAVAMSLGLTFINAFVLAMLGLLLVVPALSSLMGSLSTAVLGALGGLYWLALLLGFAVLVDHFWQGRWFRIFGTSFVLAALASSYAGLSGGALLGISVAVGIGLAFVGLSLADAAQEGPS
ncbi:MAG: PTS sugar transporter subunit IIC [candidate division FCPU426 bacterium]